MPHLPVPPPRARAAVVFFGRYGALTRLAPPRGVCRPDLYRAAQAAAAAVAFTQAPPRRRRAEQRPAEPPAPRDALRPPPRRPAALDADRQAEFAATAQALGVSRSAARALRPVLLRDATPSVAQRGRRAPRAGRRAAAALAVLDAYARPRARPVAADAIFAGRKPVLMTVEQESLCGVGGRLAPGRDRDAWAPEFRRLPALAQLTRGGGPGLRQGLAVVNAERRQAGQEEADDQDDHFHIRHRGRRGLRAVRPKAVQAFTKADEAQKALDRDRRRGARLSGGRVLAVQRLGQKAEPLGDRWAAQERGFERLRAALRLFTPQGALHTRARAEAEVAAALAGLTGPEGARVRRRRVGPQAFTFLGRAARQRAAWPVAPGRVEAAVRAEGRRRQPGAWRGAGPPAAAPRGVLRVAGLVRSLAGPAGARARALVGGVLAGVWRSSSLVGGRHGVLRRQPARQKRLTQGLVDLKRLYGNRQAFGAGKRKGPGPYRRWGRALPKGQWWDLLQRKPEELRQQLSELNPAA
jgi:hypothetical protein